MSALATLLVMSPTTDSGGAESHMLMVARAAMDAGWDVTVTFQALPETSAVARRVGTDLGARYIDAPLGDEPRRRIAGQAWATVRLVARIRPAVTLIVLPWHDRGLGCIIGAALARTPAAVIFTLAPWPVGTGRWGPLCRWAKRQNQQWIAVSDQNRAALGETFAVPAETIRTIYNGIPSVPPPTEEQRSRARSEFRWELGLDSDARVVTTIGRLTEQKGYTDLLAAIPQVLESHPDAIFAWAGEGELREQLQDQIRRRQLSGRIRLLGERADVDRVLLGSDLFLLPSRSEGLPFALLEAMSLGIPAVSSDAGGSAEVLRHGLDGVIHRREDFDDLGRHLSWALAHPLEMSRMARSARSRAERFSRERMLQESVQILDSLHSSRR